MMRNVQRHLLLYIAAILLLLQSIEAQSVKWKSVPSVRAGQIDSVVTLTTSSDISPSITDQTSEFLDTIPNTTNSIHQVGLSLVSYQSWMTDTFSFNISLVALTADNITVRFRVLNNTFFTRAKIHYIVVQRNGIGTTNSYESSSSFPSLPSSATAPTIYNDIEVIYGCYLTPTLRLNGNISRNQTIYPKLYSAIKTTNTSNANLVMKTMIAGMQLSNSVGLNDYVDVHTSFNGTGVQYNVSVQINNYLTQICLTTVIFDPAVSNYYMMTILEYQTMSLNSTNAGLSSITYSQRYDGMHRMFFGYSRFNLSMADTRQINVQTSNVSLISILYDKNTAMNEVVINMIFFAFRQCYSTIQYYDPTTYTCGATCPASTDKYPGTLPSPLPSVIYFFCNPCHYSCSSCTQGQQQDKCNLCDSTDYRTWNATNFCPCNTNYTDVGVPQCALCSSLIGGCIECSNSTHCTKCAGSPFNSNPNAVGKCVCLNSGFLISGYCLNYSGCILAQMFNNNVTCVTCDTAANYIRNDSDVTCYCNEGYIKNVSSPFNCYDQCNDSMAAKGHCDDGNLIPGDGCDENCNTQKGFHCYTTYNTSGPSISVCVLITQVSVTYLYAQRQVHTNQFTMAFKLRPPPPGLDSVSFNSTNFKTTLPVKNQKILYDPDTGIVFLTAEYLKDIEGTSHTLKISFINNQASFYADDTTSTFQAIGINSQLVIDQNASYNTILRYVIMGEGIFAILLAIFASVVGLKLAGIELLIPVQLIYFSLATLTYMPSYISTLANLKYSNGYSSIVSYDYFRTYSQHQNLVAIQYETEFLLSTNIMIGLYLLTLLWLLVHHMILKYKQHKLESFLKQSALEEDLKPKRQYRENQSNSSQDKEDGEQDEQKIKLRRAPINSQSVGRENQLREDHHYSRKIFSFEVDRFYFIFYLILINQMFFGFNVMSLNLPIKSFSFPEELSVIVCNFMLFLLMGNVVFIFYDQQSNKMINFTSITDRYAYLYLFLDAVMIIIISFTFQQKFSIYIITALSSLFLLLVFIEKPYSKNMLQFENVVAIYLHVMLLTTQVLFCVVQSSLITQQIKVIITCLIVGLILLGEILTAIRIGLKVNFKKVFDDLKSPFVDKDDDEKVKKKVIQKNLDLLGKDNVEIIPPDSVRDGLFTPKEKMIDWEARNTDEYQSLRQKDKTENSLQKDINENQSNRNEEVSQKDEKLNELQLLKKRLRNNLKQKRQSDAAALTNKKSD